MRSGYLLDTSVLSLFAPDRNVPDPDWAVWLRARSDRLYVSAITVAEIEQGICKLRRMGAAERARRLTDWLEALLAGSSDRMLAFDAKVARVAGAISDRALAAGRHPGFADVAIAATADAHQLTLLTRNARHFQPLGIAFIDPLDGLPID